MEDDDIFDSDDLLMMTMDIPEPGDDSNLNQFPLNSDPDPEEFRPRLFLRCELSKDFSSDGPVLTKEFIAFIKNESPIQGNRESEMIDLFGYDASVYSPVEEADFFKNLFLQRLTWLNSRSTASKAHIFSAAQRQMDSHDFFNLNDVVEEMSFYLQVLRFLSFQIGNNVRETTSNDAYQLILVLHSLQLHIGKATDISNEMLSDCPNRFRSPNCSLLHVKLATKWTVLVCLGYLARSKLIENCSDKILPRFAQYVGDGWNEDILLENHVDVLSVKQIDRLYRQVTFGLMFELVEISYRRLKVFETHSNSESFALCVKHSAFPCSCFKELWLMLVHVFSQRPISFWSSFPILVGWRGTAAGCSTNASSNNVPNYRYDHNSSQLQYEFKDFSFKLMFWLTCNIEPLTKLSSAGAEHLVIDASNSGFSKFVETLVEKFSERLSQTRIDENEMRAYVGAIFSLLKQTHGDSVLRVLFKLWDIFHPKLDETFMLSALTVEGLATLPTSFDVWIGNIKKIVHSDSSDSGGDISNRDSFNIFLSTIALALSSEDNDDKKAEKMTKQFFGRVRAKLTPVKFKTFEERGFRNAVSIFLTVVKVRPGDVSFVVDALCDIANALQCVNLKGTKYLFRGLCAMFVIVVEKFCQSRAEWISNCVNKIFTAILIQLEIVIKEGSSVQLSDALQDYSDLLRHPTCLSTDLLIAQNNIFHPLLVKHLEKKAPGNVIRAFHIVVLRLLRYYADLSDRGLITTTMTDADRETKNRVDATCSQGWRLVYPLVKNHLTSFHLKEGPFGELAELAYSFAVLSFNCTTSLKHLWSPASSGPPFEDTKTIFSVFGLAQQIHPMVSCAFIGHVLSGNLADVIPEVSLIEAWSRVAILLQANVDSASHFDSAREAIVHQLRRTSEQVFNLSFIKKLNLQPQASAFKKAHCLKFDDEDYVNDGDNVDIVTEALPEIQKECDIMIHSFSKLFQRQTDSDELKIRLIQVGSWFVRHWSGPLLFVESGGDNRFTKNKLGSILKQTVLKTEYVIQNASIPQNVKSVIKSCLPRVLKGLGVLAKTEQVKRYLATIFLTYTPQFPESDSHPFGQIFLQDELIDVQTCFYNFIRDPVYLEAKNSRHKRRPLIGAISILRNGLASRQQTLPVITNLVSICFFTLLDIFATIGHEETQLRQHCDEIFKIVLRTPRDGATNDVERTIEREVTAFFNEKMARYNADSMFDVLSTLAKYDRNIVRNLCPFIEEIIVRVEIQRYGGARNGRLTILFNQFVNKIKGN